MSGRRLPPLVPSQLDARQRALYDDIVGGPRKAGNLIAADGSLRGPFDLMLRSPEVGTPLQQLGAALRFGASLDDDLRELAILLTAATWESDFEWAVHQPLAESAGVPAAVLDAVRAGAPVVSDDERYVVVVQAAREAFRDRSVSASTFAELHRTLGDRQVVEVLTIFGYYTTLALLLNSYGIAP